MGKYRKKPVVIEAVQWFGHGDSDDVIPYMDSGRVDWLQNCAECNGTIDEHGWIKTLEGGHIVCPTDFIITGVKGEKYPCKYDIFLLTYEKVE